MKTPDTAKILNKIAQKEQDPLIQYFVTLGLLEKGALYSGSQGVFYYSLTSKGKEIYDKILFSDSSKMDAKNNSD